MFYVYMHLKKDGTPFYVGKGCKNRAYTKANRSNWWKSVVKKEYGKDFPTVQFLDEQLDEQTAIDREKFWIAKFGRKRVHKNGTLVNHTDGGEGIINPSEEVRYKIGTAMRGKKHKPSSIEKMSKSRSGINHPMFGKHFSKEFCEKQSLLKRGNKYRLGKTFSEESKRKMSQAQLGKVIPIDIRNKISKGMGGKAVYLKSPTGEIVLVENQSEFARKYGLIRTKISEVIRGIGKTHKGWTLLTISTDEVK